MKKDNKPKGWDVKVRDIFSIPDVGTTGYVNPRSTLDVLESSGGETRNVSPWKRHAPNDKVVAHVQVGVQEKVKKLQGILDETLVRAGLAKSFHSEFYGKSLLRNFEAVLPRKDAESEMAYARRALGSSDMEFLLENLSEKAALVAFDLGSTTTHRLWTKYGNIDSYKPSSQMKHGGFGEIYERQEHGEVVENQFQESREQVSLRDFAAKMVITENIIRNDDIGEIARIMSEAGVAAACKENDLCYQVLVNNAAMADGHNLFSAQHANLGAGGVISSTTLGEGLKLIKQQKSVGGGRALNLSAKYLLCGPELEAVARKEVRLINLGNSSQNALEVIVDAQISGSKYFFVARPSDLAGVILYRLPGDERPRVASQRNAFGDNSLTIRVAHTCEAAAVDPRPIVYNPGS